MLMIKMTQQVFKANLIMFVFCLFSVCVRTMHPVPKGRLKVAQDVVLGSDNQAGQSREGRLNSGAEVSAVPSGLIDDAFLTQDYVLGYFQTSLRD